MTQFFKGDATELKYFDSAAPIVDLLGDQKTTFFDEAFECFVLGETLYDAGRAPLTNAIPRAVFRQSFAAIFDAFVSAGTFESYLTVFRAIFGEDVDVTFTVPAAGKLNIDIVASSEGLFDFIANSVVGSVFVEDEVVDESGDNIAFQTLQGLETEYEVEQMLFELVPAGIFTQISLSLS